MFHLQSMLFVVLMNASQDKSKLRIANGVSCIVTDIACRRKISGSKSVTGNTYRGILWFYLFPEIKYQEIGYGRFRCFRFLLFQWFCLYYVKH
jgi:hypothetical protein